MAAWPVLRAIWWWLPELAVTGGLAVGWVELAGHTALIPRLLLTAALAGIPAAIGPVRRGIYRMAWCLVSRHRIRTCFSEFIITNRTGSLPLILPARPTPAGERMWVWLRPGLCLADVQDRAEEIAAACWATAVVADLASASNSALVRIDIKRRDPLTGTVGSPLAQLLSGALPARRTLQAPALRPSTCRTSRPRRYRASPARTGQPHGRRQSRPKPAPAADGNGSADDITDWL